MFENPLRPVFCYTFNREYYFFKYRGMAHRFKVGDRVKWNSEAGYVTGVIVKIHRSDFSYKGYTHHATMEDPQYEIKSDKTDHIAAHKGAALRKIPGKRK